MSNAVNEAARALVRACLEWPTVDANYAHTYAAARAESIRLREQAIADASAQLAAALDALAKDVKP